MENPPKDNNANNEELNTVIQGLEYQNELVKQKFKLREQELLDALKEKDNEIDRLKRKTFILIQEKNSIENHNFSGENNLLEKKCKEYEVQIKSLDYQLNMMRQSKEKLLKDCDELSYRVIDLDRELGDSRNACSQLRNELDAVKEINLKLKNELVTYRNEKDNQDFEFISKKTFTKNDELTRKIVTNKGKEKICASNVATPLAEAKHIMENSMKDIHSAFNDFKKELNLKMSEYKNSFMHEIEDPLNEITKNFHKMCVQENKLIQISIKEEKGHQEEIKREIDGLNESNKKILRDLRRLRGLMDAEVENGIETESKVSPVITVSATSSQEDDSKYQDELNKHANVESIARTVTVKGKRGGGNGARSRKAERKILTENQNQQLQNNDVSSFVEEIAPVPASEVAKITTKKGRSVKARKIADSGKTDKNGSNENLAALKEKPSGKRIKIRNDNNENLSPRIGLRSRKNELPVDN